MKETYISPSLLIMQVQPELCIVQSQTMQAGPTADFMSDPDVSDVKSAYSDDHSVWDDDWSQEP